VGLRRGGEKGVGETQGEGLERGLGGGLELKRGDAPRAGAP
jgi:hypothetical protein